MRPASVGFHCPDDVAEARRTVRAPRTSVGAKILETRPYVTLTLLALNAAAYVVTATAAGASFANPTNPRSSDALFYKWQLQPLAVHELNRYYELVTSAFLHVSLLHILSNMLALVFIGPALEQLLGWWRFAAVYVLSALGGSAAIYAFGNVCAPTVGASGAVFGLFGACLVLVRKLGLDLQWLVSIVAINFVLTFSIHGISKLGHIGGFVAGMLAALAIGGLPSVRARVPTPVQTAGLLGLLALVVLAVGLRTATWVTPASC
jgi:membrane associated rhomboid family serine protease